MRKIGQVFIVLLIVFGMTLVGAAVWLWSAQWPMLVALLVLIGAAFLVVMRAAKPLEEWRELLFGKEKDKDAPNPAETAAPSRAQEVVRSEKVRQRMHGAAGEMTQRAVDSTDVKQDMD